MTMPLLMNPNHNSNHRQGLAGIKLFRRPFQSSKLIPEDVRDDQSTASFSGDTFSSLKSVHFSQDQIVHIVSMNEDSDEIQRRWYQEDDYKRFEKDRMLTSFEYQAIIPKTNFNQDEHSIRGLELVINRRLRRRHVGEKKDLASAIEAEEYSQKKDGSFPDIERFRIVSLKHTRSARDRAINIAAEDAKETRGKPKSWLLRRGKSKFAIPCRISSI